MLKFEQP